MFSPLTAKERTDMAQVEPHIEQQQRDGEEVSAVEQYALSKGRRQ